MMLYGLIKMGMEAHIPKRTINKRKKDKPWMTGYIRYQIFRTSCPGCTHLITSMIIKQNISGGGSVF